MKSLKTLAFTMCTICLCGCNSMKLLPEIKKIQTQLSKLDSIYRYRESKLYEYERTKIDCTYRNITDADLLRRINTITRPKN